MIEILLGILLITSIAILFFQFQNKSNNTDVKFQSSLDEKIKHIHDELGRNRDESNKSSKQNRDELTTTLNQFEEKFGKNLKEIKDTVNNQLKDIRNDNTKQLDKMRDTVDQKLKETLEKKIV